MAAVQTPGTPAVATTEAATTEVASTGDALLDALASIPLEGVAEPAAAGEAATEKPAEKTEPEKKPEGEKKTRHDVEAELLEEGVLGTKEGIEKAKGYFRRRQGKLDGIDVRLAEKAEALRTQEETIRSAYEAAQAELDTDRKRAAAIRHIDDKLTNGTIEEMLETLGRIRGKTGREVWDHMARVAISMGKNAPVAAPVEIQRLESKIEQLENLLTDRERRETEAQESGQEQQLRAGLKEREQAVISAASDATKFPELARYVKLGLGESIVTELVKQKLAAKRAGRNLDNAGALAHIEAELKRLPAGATPASPAGVRPASPAAVSADDLPIAGIAPSQTRSAGSVRDKTEAELAEDLAKDPNLLGYLGF